MRLLLISVDKIVANFNEGIVSPLRNGVPVYRVAREVAAVGLVAAHAERLVLLQEFQ